MKRLAGLFFQTLGILTTVVIVLGAAGLLFAGTWLKVNDPPEKADAIVLLGGDSSRALYGADLFAEGYAPLVYVSRPVRHPSDIQLEELGIPMRRQEETYRLALKAKGVPDSAIRYFGNGSISTVDEADVLAGTFPAPGTVLLVVTSPFHTRRAKTVLQDAMPNTRIVMVSTPYEEFPEKWWTSFLAARNVVLETAKTLFHMLGGAYRSHNASVSPDSAPVSAD